MLGFAAGLTEKTTAVKPLKIFIDGAFDLTHYGHMNAFRHARERGGYLVVGVNSDESVRECKGASPILNDAERQAAVAACRFVDEVLPATPYVMSAEYIEELMRVHEIDYFVHGDDPCLVDGKDVYDAARKAGKFFTIPRTEGISTTDVVGRLVLSTKCHLRAVDEPSTMISSQSRYLTTCWQLRAFSASSGKRKSDNSGKHVVYVDGSWDLFHAGHAEVLRKASEMGDFVIVGVHSDLLVNGAVGGNYPIMTHDERMLSVSGCRFVDDVVLNAPMELTREVIATLRICTILVPTNLDYPGLGLGRADRHRTPRELGLVVECQQTSGLSCHEIAKRLMARTEVEARHADKQQKERDWFNAKHALTLASV